MATDAGTAAHHTNGTTGIHKDVDQAVFDGLLVNHSAGRGDDGACEGGNFFALKNTGSNFQVFIAPIGAGANEHLVNGHAGDFGKGPDMVDIGVAGYLFFNLADINGDHFFINRVDCTDHFKRPAGFCLVFQKIERFPVGSNQPTLGTHLGGHVGKNDAGMHGQVIDVAAGKLEGFIGAAVHAQQPGHIEHDILGIGAGARLAFEADQNSGGYFKPGLASGPGDTNLSGAKAGGKGTKSAVGVGVRISTDNHRPGFDKTFFNHYLVADTLVVEVFNALFTNKFERFFLVLGRLNIGRRVSMIKMDHNFINITQRFADFAKGFNCQRRGIVMAHDKVNIEQHNFAGADLPPDFTGENLFNQCSHLNSYCRLFSVCFLRTMRVSVCLIP